MCRVNVTAGERSRLRLLVKPSFFARATWHDARSFAAENLV
jgi:hypothetical protein